MYIYVLSGAPYLLKSQPAADSLTHTDSVMTVMNLYESMHTQLGYI